MSPQLFQSVAQAHVEAVMYDADKRRSVAESAAPRRTSFARVVSIVARRERRALPARAAGTCA
jgi:hypothetical protein